MNNQGWVKLHRCIADNKLWFKEPFTRGQAWVDLFLHANHKDGIIIIRGNVVTIKRGQIGWSEVNMGTRWKWSRNKVRRFLKLLETIQQIEQQKTKYITTIITILNYEKYQSETADDTAERQQTIQQKDSRRYINKNDKNVKNDKNEKKERETLPSSRFIKPSIEEVREHLKEKQREDLTEQFYNHYEGNGWKIGKNKMVSWKATASNWVARDNKNKPQGVKVIRYKTKK